MQSDDTARDGVRGFGGKFEAPRRAEEPHRLPLHDAHVAVTLRRHDGARLVLVHEAGAVVVLAEEVGPVRLERSTERCEQKGVSRKV